MFKIIQVFGKKCVSQAKQDPGCEQASSKMQTGLDYLFCRKFVQIKSNRLYFGWSMETVNVEKFETGIVHTTSDQKLWTRNM